VSKDSRLLNLGSGNYYTEGLRHQLNHPNEPMDVDPAAVAELERAGYSFFH
jgi:hypothetical protein